MNIIYRQENLAHIRARFERETGVTLPGRRSPAYAARFAAALAAVLLLSVTVLAAGRFSALEGDELSLSARYEGNGIVTIAAENRSDKTLSFEDKLRLIRWSTGESVALRGSVGFTGIRLAPHSGGTMTVDLSGACDVGALEEPIEDWYYFVLTDQHFLFGHDWMCSVHFAPPRFAESPDEQPAIPGETPYPSDGIEAVLRPYFERIEPDAEKRRSLNEAYARQVDELLCGFDGTVVRSVPSTLLPDVPEDVLSEEDRLLTGLHSRTMDRSFKLLASQGEYAEVLSVLIPLTGYSDAYRDMPLLYYFTYGKSEITDDAYAFVHGHLVPFSRLEDSKVWENEEYAVYELHELMEPDLDEEIRQWLACNPDTFCDDLTRQRVQRVFDCYSDYVFFREF